MLLPTDGRSEHASHWASPFPALEEVNVESTLALAAATWAIAMALGPVLQIRKIVAYGNSESVSISYFLVLFVGFLLWIVYGVAADNLALIIPNAVAAAVIVLTIVVALRFRQGREQQLRSGESRR